MGKCWAQPVTPEIQITMTKCCSPETPEDASKAWHLFGGRQGSQQLATTKPYRMHTLHSNASPAIWRNYQKCRHRCMGTDVNQSHLFLPRQAECPILWAVWGLKAQARKVLKNEGDQAGTRLSPSKVFALQVWGPEFRLQNPLKMLGSIHLLPRLGRWRLGDPWGSLARQSSLIADL